MVKEVEMKDYKSFRVGNPVLVFDDIRYIRSLPSDEQDAVHGFYFYSDGNVAQSVEPFPIDDGFLRIYEHTKKGDGTDSFYRFQKSVLWPNQVINMDEPVLKYYPQKQECVISCIDWSETLFFSVNALHELYNLIEDYCGYCLPRYYPHINNNEPLIDSKSFEYGYEREHE